jgi:hypothetical protein
MGLDCLDQLDWSKMEQMMEHLWTYQEEMEAEKRAHWERLEALMDASTGQMEVCLGVVEACPGKMEATLKASQEQMGAESKTGLEEVKATGLEANQEMIGAIVEHHA